MRHVLMTAALVLVLAACGGEAVAPDEPAPLDGHNTDGRPAATSIPVDLACTDAPGHDLAWAMHLAAGDGDWSVLAVQRVDLAASVSLDGRELSDALHVLGFVREDSSGTRETGAMVCATDLDADGPADTGYGCRMIEAEGPGDREASAELVEAAVAAAACAEAAVP